MAEAAPAETPVEDAPAPHVEEAAPGSAPDGKIPEAQGAETVAQEAAPTGDGEAAPTEVVPTPKGSPKVVIVGGGIAGSSAAKHLEDFADVTLIDSKEFLEILWAGLRALVEPAVAERILIPHSSYLKKAKVVVGVATAVTDKEVKVGEDVYPYDYLVLASGRLAETQTRAQRVEQIQAEHEKLKAAKNILVVGGGPTGVELAAEIVTDFPEKKVTLVHGGARLLEFVGEKAGVKALKWLESNGVSVKLNERVDVTSEQWGSSGSFKLQSGETIETDYLAVTTGTRPNATWLEETFSAVVEKSNVKVDPFLNVEGYKNVFAAGDVALLNPKQGYLAGIQAQLVANNLKLLIEADTKGKPVRPLKKYPPPANVALITLGRKNGIAQLPFGTFTGWFPTMMKSKDLFIEKVWKDLKATKP